MRSTRPFLRRNDGQGLRHKKGICSGDGQFRQTEPVETQGRLPAGSGSCCHGHVGTDGPRRDLGTGSDISGQRAAYHGGKWCCTRGGSDFGRAGAGTW